MTERTIKQIINKKVNDWIDTITDESVVETIRKNLVITGGCFTSMLQNESPKDFDCYLKTKEAAKIVAEYYISVWDKSNGVELRDEGDRIKLYISSSGVVGDPETVRADEELGTAIEQTTELDEAAADAILEKETRRYEPVFMSANAITLSNGIQIVLRFYGDPVEIHDTFDFEHTKAYWTSWENKVEIPREVYECVINKTLRYTGSKYPVCSLFRLRKFIARGWTINAGQILKIAFQVSELDLTDINTLEDQLIGVDSLYFMQLIHQFRAQQEKGDFTLTTGYVMSIIDKIF